MATALAWTMMSVQLTPRTLPEEEPGELSRKRSRAGDNDDAQCKQADEEEADRRVLGEPGALADDGDADDNNCRSHGRADRRVDADEERDRDARDDAVRERIAEEVESAQHDPDADQGALGRDERSGQQRTLHEGGFERIGEPVHLVRASF